MKKKNLSVICELKIKSFKSSSLEFATFQPDTPYAPSQNVAS